MALIFAASAWSCHTSSRQPRFDMPDVVLWAWERPEDLRFLDTRRAGVAFVAADALIAADGSVSFRPTTQSLLLPADAAALAVVHVESAFTHETVQTQTLPSGLNHRPVLMG